MYDMFETKTMSVFFSKKIPIKFCIDKFKMFNN